MIQIKKIKAISAIVAVSTCIILAIAVILGIWVELGKNEIYWKLVNTTVVLLLLSGFIHAVAKGMESKEN